MSAHPRKARSGLHLGASLHGVSPSQRMASACADGIMHQARSRHGTARKQIARHTWAVVASKGGRLVAAEPVSVPDSA
eukprot:383460-Rhodomonas_salina.4